VRFAVWDSDAVEVCEQAHLTQQQRALVEGLWRSLEPGTLMSGHVAGLNSAVLALTRAHHALRSHAEEGQPLWPLTKGLIDCSLVSVRAATPVYQTTSVGAALIAQAEQLLVSAGTTLTGTSNAAAKLALARAIEAVVEPAAMAVRGLFEVLWSGTALPVDLAARITGEVAVLAVLEGRDGHALRGELLAALRRGLSTAADLEHVLWPSRRRFRVAVAVLGTRVLEDLDELLAGAQQWPIFKVDVARGLPRSPELRTLIKSVRSNVSPAVLVQVPVDARDAQRAITEARRALSETLDQYAAGQRLLTLTLGNLAVAIDPSNEPRAFDVRTGGARIAKPLTRHWSASLRPGLRMANLARQVEAPMASTALAWSALEAIGVTKSYDEKAAKAVALHSTRQQILGLYKSVTASALARLEHAQWQVEQTTVALRRSERSQSLAAASTSEKAQAAASAHALAALQLSTELAVLTTETSGGDNGQATSARSGSAPGNARASW